MISFACKKVDVKDIVMCGFDLRRTEYEVLLALLKEEEASSIQDLSTQHGLDRSTVQKAISRLVAKELVERRQINIPAGGYRYLYLVPEKSAIKARLTRIVEGWQANVKDEIQRW
jgi:predicted transcriptional regulator